MLSLESFRVLRDLTAGTIGACSGIVAGQPLDTIKVRLQSAPGLYRGALDCTLQTIRREGFLSLYKGMASPLLGNAPLNAIVFGCNGHMNRWLDRHFPRSEARKLDPTPDYLRLYASATWGGIAQCVVATPVELVKCKLQVQGMTPDAPQRYAGTWDCFKQLFQSGGVRAVYRGWWSTLARDGPSYGAWFVAFEYVRFHLTPKGESSSTPVLLFAGGLAGIATWLSTYPFDVIKSVVQTLPDDTPRRELTMAHISRVNYRQHGARWFFTGLGPTLVRAVPVSAVTFWVYEKCLDVMGRD